MFNVIIESWDYDITKGGLHYVVYCMQDCSIPGKKIKVVKYEHKNAQNANKNQLFINEILLNISLN